MLTIQTSSGKIEINEIVQGLAQLKAPDLEGVTKKLLQILEKKNSSGISKKEQELIDKIKNGGPSEELRRRQRELLSKSVQGIMTDEENQEALQLVPIFEKWDVERVKLMIELADLWHTSLDGVMQKLNITPPADVCA